MPLPLENYKDGSVLAAAAIPPAARPLVGTVHRRYAVACERGERPAIEDPRVSAALLTPSECVALAKMGYYPLPPNAIQHGMTLAEYQHQQILAAVAEQMPDAISALLETMEA